MEDPSLIGEPTDAQLLAWFQAHSSRYAENPSTDFTHVYFSGAQRGAKGLSDANRELAILQARKLVPASVGDVGDAFISGFEFQGQTVGKLTQQFGPPFAQAVEKAAPGSWTGPVASPFGFHLIWVYKRSPGQVPAFAAVRSKVLADFMNAQVHTVERQAYVKLLSRYTVRADMAAERRR
jgi:hypothetical protein